MGEGAMSETELESLLLEGGARLLEPPADVDELIDLLDVRLVLGFGVFSVFVVVDVVVVVIDLFV